MFVALLVSVSLCVGLPAGPPHQALNATLLPECAEECGG